MIYAEDAPDGPGRDAVLPRQMGWRAWWAVFKRFGASFLDDHLSLVAAGVAYWSMLALFPALALFVSLYGLFADPAQAADQAIAMASVLPDDAADVLYDEMTRVAGASGGSLSLSALVSVALTLWGSNRCMKAVFEALNVAYRERETRNIVWINILGLCFTLGFILFGVLSVVLVVAVPPALQALRLGGGFETVLTFLRWPILFGGMFAGTTLLYTFGPDRKAARFAWVSWGSTLAGFLWLGASGLISWYAASFADFNKTYGGLGAVVILQTWMWLTALVVIVGAKLNAEAEHQTAVDTTRGRPKPMGERGAHVADTLPKDGRPEPIMGSERR